jgi:hypothetical protein
MTNTQKDESVTLSDGSIHTSARASIDDRSKAFILAVLVSINVISTTMMFIEWRIAERETRMLEYYLLELDAKFIGAGLKKPDDSIAKHLKEIKP